MQIHNILACPACHGKLIKQTMRFRCLMCNRLYLTRWGIPNFIPFQKFARSLKKSQREYEQIHQKPWDQLKDGSYEILTSFARGNKTLDIACGDGFIEELSPNTVGVDFSLNALLKAKKRGAKYLYQAVAEYLPFKNNSFDLAICAGSLEHFADPQAAILEMARVARMQLLTVHTSIPGHGLLTQIFRVRHQPIEKPIGTARLMKMLTRAGLHVVFKGVWTLPVNYGRVVTWLPELQFIPSSSFVISIKKS